MTGLRKNAELLIETWSDEEIVSTLETVESCWRDAHAHGERVWMDFMAGRHVEIEKELLDRLKGRRIVEESRHMRSSAVANVRFDITLICERFQRVKALVLRTQRIAESHGLELPLNAAHVAYIIDLACATLTDGPVDHEQVRLATYVVGYIDGWHTAVREWLEDGATGEEAT